MKKFPDERNWQCLFDSLTYLAILWMFLSVFKHLIFLAITRRNSSMSIPPLLCAEGILKQIHKHFSFVFQCPVWCGEGILKHTHARKHISFDFATHQSPLTCQCPSQVQAAAPKIWDDGWQLYIIILSTYLSGRKLETRYHHHHRGNLLADCFHLFSFWVLAQRPQQITQLLLDNCVSMSQLGRAG